MKVLGLVNGNPIGGIVFDIDNTVYPRSPAYFDEGSRLELEGAAECLGLSFEALEPKFKAKRQEIEQQQGRKAAVTETLYALGLTPEQWSELRLIAWQPEKWILPDEEISRFFAKLSQQYQVAFGTNSPIEIGKRVLSIIGILAAVPQVKIYGPEVLGASKPEAAFYTGIAQRLGLPPGQCLSIGDRDFSDGPPAVQAGYAGAIIVPGSRDELLNIGPELLAGNWQTIRQQEQGMEVAYG
ncbi:MAG: HAD family hydrolase [Patescibacteria group bacterium]